MGKMKMPRNEIHFGIDENNIFYVSDYYYLPHVYHRYP